MTQNFGILLFGLFAWLSGCSYGVWDETCNYRRCAIAQVVCLAGMSLGGILIGYR